MTTTDPIRHRQPWTTLEHYQLAHLFARNGFVHLPLNHPDLLAFAAYWGRTPKAIENQVCDYIEALTATRTGPGYDIVDALRLAADPAAVASLRAGVAA